MKENKKTTGNIDLLAIYEWAWVFAVPLKCCLDEAKREFTIKTIEILFNNCVPSYSWDLSHNIQFLFTIFANFQLNAILCVCW